MKQFYPLLGLFFLIFIRQANSQTGIPTGSLTSTQTCITIKGNKTDGKFIQAHMSDMHPNASDTTQPELVAAAWTCNAIGYPTCNFRAIFRFNVSQIPSNAVIVSAKLHLYAKTSNLNGNPGNPTFGSNNTTVLQKVISPWSLATVTWNNQPSVTTSGQVVLPQSTNTAQNYVVDVKNFVQGWVNNPASNYGVLFRLLTENYYNSMVFHSGSSPENVQPKLEICYVTSPTGFPTGSDTSCTNGIPLFMKEYRASGDQFIYSVARTTDSGYVSVGYTNTIGNGGHDGLLLKVDRKGNRVWSKAIGGGGNDYFYQVRATGDGGVIAAGQTKSYGNPAGDAWLVKLDALGNVQWSKKYGDGNVNGEVAWDVIQLSDGGYAFAGSHRFAPGTAEGFVVRTNSQGDVVWSRQYGNWNSDELAGIVEDGNSLVVAGFYYGVSYFDGYVMKLDKSNGDVQWIKGYDIENRATRPNRIAKTALGYQVNCIVASDWGSTNQQQCILNIGTDGTLQSIRKLSIPGTQTNSVGWYPLADGGFIATNGEDNSSSDVLLSRVKADGSLAWSKKIVKSGRQLMASLTGSPDGGYVGAGITNNAGTIADSNDVYIIRVDSLGEAGNCSGENTTEVSVVTPSYTEPSPNVTALGNVTINNPVITVGVVNMTPSANTLCFYCKKKPTGNLRSFVTVMPDKHELKVYPNPVSGNSVTLSIEAKFDDRAIINIVDLYGNILYTSVAKEIKMGNNLVNLNLPQNLRVYSHYFIHILFNKHSQTEKIFVTK